MAIVGGLRVRLIYDSLYNEIERALSELGWFDSGREHLPVSFISQPVDDKEGIDLNTLVLLGEDQFDNEEEMGSSFAEHRRQFFLDFYGESQPLGEHVIFDCRDILEGRMPSVSRDGPVFTLRDYTTLGAPTFGTAEIEFVNVDRAHNINYPWQKNWYSCSFTVVDYYGNEDD
jgi:hypothetical protein